MRHSAVESTLPEGAARVEVLTRAVAARGVEVLTNTAMRSLITEDGTVTGAEVETSPGGTLRIHAAGGTVVASGGFEADAESCAAYLPVEPVFPVGTLDTTGDGLRAG